MQPSAEMNAPGKDRALRVMFAEIAPSYDWLNHALSMNIDKRWRRLVVSKLEDVISSPDSIALDICCGTGDLTLELARKTRVIGCDFCHPMLLIGRKKAQAREAALSHPVILAEGDALHLPFVREQFDAVTIAFGLRNLVNVQEGLSEILRVLKPGGRAAVLELSHPTLPILRRAFGFYFDHILPRIGAIVSGSTFAYQYLPDSVRAFPNQQLLAEMMRAAGFVKVDYSNLSGGIAALHIGERAQM
jgi:demethylmenaquinone methyltransferase / 2-methoxy-6-polyprenyl-1,4-benzoquinol methylase